MTRIKLLYKSFFIPFIHTYEKSLSAIENNHILKIAGRLQKIMVCKVKYVIETKYPNFGTVKQMEHEPLNFVFFHGI